MFTATDPLSWLTRIHGHSAWLLVYALVAVPLLVGLIRARAKVAKLLFFPILALPVTVLALLFVSMLRSSLASWSPDLLTARGFELTGLMTLMLFGYLGGVAAARSESDLTHKRGTRIEDGTEAQPTQATRAGQARSPWPASRSRRWTRPSTSR